jgi:hypothetical protein
LRWRRARDDVSARLEAGFSTMMSGRASHGGSRGHRYDLTDALDLGQRGEAIKHARKRGLVDPVTAAVADPTKSLEPLKPGKRGALAGPKRVLATVNRKVDILELELGHGRIGAGAYSEGRVIQALYERPGLSGGSTWNEGSRVDAVVAKELAVIRRVDNARAITAMVADIEKLVGMIDARILREILGENRSYAAVTQTLDLRSAATRSPDVNAWVPLGKGGKRAPSSRETAARRIAYVAQRFRDALETLADRRRR